MRIDSFQFGKIVVDKVSYRNDLVLTPQGVIPDWWRGESHLLTLADVQKFDFTDIRCVIVGTGVSGMMKIAQPVRDFFTLREIEYYQHGTPKAVALYNHMPPEHTLALFHITC